MNLKDTSFVYFSAEMESSRVFLFTVVSLESCQEIILKQQIREYR